MMDSMDDILVPSPHNHSINTDSKNTILHKKKKFPQILPSVEETNEVEDLQSSMATTRLDGAQNENWEWSTSGDDDSFGDSDEDESCGWSDSQDDDSFADSDEDGERGTSRYGDDDSFVQSDSDQEREWSLYGDDESFRESDIDSQDSTDLEPSEYGGEDDGSGVAQRPFDHAGVTEGAGGTVVEEEDDCFNNENIIYYDDSSDDGDAGRYP